ncbi:lipopolysaccharide export system protein LptA [Rhizobium azooxidifex]|uniref:Lipopolysaccharide export system protein LptA n=1 Tax=Mycoplana azooxidifex TaxID=1636188 RepID=A0A7W6GIK4_9HYPH|nr:LptA/OstA family protein [Mycoplana azooxidifex]MBB3976307.1 lipopolysaccharide export system protein LptA [Mycoplana azooxidifex]
MSAFSEPAQRHAILPLLAAGLLLAATTAGAQETKSQLKGLQLSNDQPIQIQSDKLEIQQQSNTAQFTGNVKVVQGTTTLQAGSMVVHYTAQGGGSISSGDADIEKIEVADKVFLQSGTQEATADTGTFNLIDEVFVLKGDKVVLSEGKNVFVGCQLTVLMRTGEAKLDACGGRVMIQLDPKSRKTAN